MPRFKIRNCSQDRRPRNRLVSGFTIRPEVGGRVLAPGAVRYISLDEITARVLDDIDRYRDMGVVSFTREFGRPTEVDTAALREQLGIKAPEPVVLTERLEKDLEAMQVATQAMAPLEVVQKGVDLHWSEIDTNGDGDSLKDSGPVAEALRGQTQDAVYVDEAPPAAVVEEIERAPEPEESVDPDAQISRADDLLDPEPEPTPDPDAPKVRTEAELTALKSAELDEILVGELGFDSKKLYTIGKKAEKVAKILELQTTG